MTRHLTRLNYQLRYLLQVFAGAPVQAESHEATQTITEVQTVQTHEAAPAAQYEPAAEVSSVS